MEPQKTPVAVVQPLAHDRSGFTRAWPRVLAQLERACTGGTRLVVLPEGTIPGYVLGTQPVAREEIAGALDDLAACARRFAATIVCGVARVEDGRTYNAALALGPDGRELGYAAKQFLWHFDRHWFAPGATLDPIETPAGVLGVLVCADGRIPTIAATLVERGAQMLVMPTAWVTSGRDPHAFENLQADLLAAVRARENGVPFVAANKAGVEVASVAYCGKSLIVDAAGAVLARANERDEEVLRATIDLDGARGVIRDPWRPLNPAHEPPERARFAFTPARGTELVALEASAREADATAVLSIEDAACPNGPQLVERAGVRFAAVPSEIARAPRGLVAARLAGIDAFIWSEPHDAWTVPFARARSAELRAYVVVFAGDERAFAVDPDGVVIAGTFGAFRMAAFGYERARTRTTTVAPATDVLDGLRTAEALRA